MKIVLIFVGMAIWSIIPSSYAAEAELIWGHEAEFIAMNKGETSQDLIKQNLYYGLEKQLKKLAKKLPEEQLLKVYITELNLAGNIFMTPSGQMQRIVAELDSPSISFHYQLFDGNKQIIEQGEKNIRNSAYISNTPNSLRNTEFGYEMYLFNIFFRKHSFDS